MCTTAACWKVFWEKCLLMSWALEASLSAALWTHYQTDRWRLLMLIGVLSLASIAWKFLLTARAAALAGAHFRSWVGRKSEGKVEEEPSVAKWNSLSLHFKAAGNISEWKHQCITAAGWELWQQPLKQPQHWASVRTFHSSLHHYFFYTSRFVTG